MAQRVADTLVLVLPSGASLRHWGDSGVLAREWAYWRELLTGYNDLVLVTHGDARDGDVVACLADAAERVRVVSNAAGRPASMHADTLPALVSDQVGRAGRVVVRTAEMAGGEAAAHITRALRDAGKTAALIARGGHLWTRFVAHDAGPQSSEALMAAQRERLLCQAADIVIGTTPDMISDLAWRYGLDPSRCVALPNFVLTGEAPRAASDRTRGRVLYAGQLIPRKRVDLLIRAMSLLAEDTRAYARLDIIGEGPQRSALEDLARATDANVTFSPRIPYEQLMERMNTCSIYAQTSELEGHPRAVLEAMAAGAAVLVTNSPGLCDVVIHGMNGLVIEPDPAAFANAIDELLRDDEWREVMGAAAARSVCMELGLARIAARELDVHRRALELACGADRRAIA